MNIYAKKGHKVMVTEESALNGHDHDIKKVKEFLIIGRVYTVEKTNVEGWSSTVFISDFPTIDFNTVNFVDVD